MDRDDWKSQIELDRWTNELERLSNKQYKAADTAMFNAYKDTLREIKVDLKNYVENYETLSFSKRLEAERLFKAAGDIDQVLDTTFKKVGQAAVDYKTAEASLGYNGVFYAMEGRDNLQFTGFGINKRFIEATVNAPVAGKRLSTRLYQNQQKLAKTMTNTIIRETAKGKGYAYIAKRVADQTEASYKNSLRIARTEAGRVQTLATQKGYDDAVELGVTELQKRWVSSMDRRTRESHGIADGQTVNYDANFQVGSATGSGPRNMGRAEEDINCFPADTLTQAGDVDGAYKRYYSGDLIEIETGKGKKLSGTPNHPVLTTKGWVALGKLNKGDNLISYEAKVSDTTGTHDVEASIAEIGEVFNSLAMTGDVMRERSRTVDFHGDGSDGYVDIVSADGPLRVSGETSADKFVREFLLPSTDPRAGSVVGDGTQSESGFGVNPPSGGSIGGGHPDFTRRRSGLRSLDKICLAAVTSNNSVLNEKPFDGLAGDSEPGSQSLLGLSGEIFIDDVVATRWYSFSGHVYNLSTKTGAYVVGGIIAHNCRCTTIAVVGEVEPELRRIGGGITEYTTYGKWLKAKG